MNCILLPHNYHNIHDTFVSDFLAKNYTKYSQCRETKIVFFPDLTVLNRVLEFDTSEKKTNLFSLRKGKIYNCGVTYIFCQIQDK